MYGRVVLIHGRRPGRLCTSGSAVFSQLSPNKHDNGPCHKGAPLGDTWTEAGPLTLIALVGFLKPTPRWSHKFTSLWLISTLGGCYPSPGGCGGSSFNACDACLVQEHYAGVLV